MKPSEDDVRLEARAAGSSGSQPEPGNERQVRRVPPAAGSARPDHAPSGAEVLKVSTRSRPSAVAGAIAGVIRESGIAEVQSIGAGATNQAIKAVAIARSYLSEEGIDIYCVPSFIDVAIDEEERTAIKLVIHRRDKI
ncbi:stage V sporulation protein S [Kallotenue papyrolyticum]|uniref:stage V sporulation protein S n=1 Tax=Kallotenue papyrolyticum TaxID=1325125 RepID=UPI0004785E2F|nr:stage V sporulation protein S [Kallotenue papyrolyticum]